METDPKAKVERGAAERLASFRATALMALILAFALFAANNLNLLRAWLQPPQGWHPVYVARDLDVAQHLTWVNAMKDQWLAPNFHAAVVTKRGLFSPLMGLLGHIAGLGIDASLVYAVTQFLLYFVGICALFWCLRIFTTSRAQVYGVLLCMLCVFSARAFAGLAMFIAGRTRASPVSLLERDGFLFHGPLTLTFGTVAVFVSLALIGAYVRSNRNTLLLVSAGAVTGLSGLLHPFEVFAIMVGAALSFICTGWPRLRRALIETLVICVPGTLAVLPYVWFSLRVDWLGPITKRNQFGVDPLPYIFLELGIPATLALVVLVCAPRMRKPLDIVLQCWFVGALIMLQVPGLTYRWHLADGLTLVTALLLVRQFSTLPALKDWLVRHRRFAVIAGSVVLGLGLCIHTVHRYVAFRDGNQIGRESLVSQEEAGTITWLRQHGKPEELVLAPPESGPWVATVPIHSFASHWLFSGDYHGQLRKSAEFYSGALGEDGTRRFLRENGVNYIAVPLTSPAIKLLPVQNKVAQIGSWSIYYFPENRMPLYTEGR